MEHIVRTAYRRRYAFCIPYVTKEETESFVAKSASHLILLGFISTEDVYLADALFQKVCRHSGPEGARSSCDSNHGIVERIHLIFLTFCCRNGLDQYGFNRINPCTPGKMFEICLASTVLKFFIIR